MEEELVKLARRTLEEVVIYAPNIEPLLNAEVLEDALTYITRRERFERNLAETVAKREAIQKEEAEAKRKADPMWGLF